MVTQLFQLSQSAENRAFRSMPSSFFIRSIRSFTVCSYMRALLGGQVDVDLRLLLVRQIQLDRGIFLFAAQHEGLNNC